MKIVHVEDFFHPDAGYQLNVLAKFMAQEGHEIIILSAQAEGIPGNLVSFFGKEDLDKRDREYERLYGVKIIRLPVAGYYSGRVFFKKGWLKVIKDIDPDVVFIHGNDTFTAISYLFAYKKMPYTLVMDSHMLEMASRNKLRGVFHRLYRYFITPQIIKNKIPVIRTQNSDYVEKHLGIPLSQCPWISVGSDTMLFVPDKCSRKLNRRQYKIQDNDFVITYAGKLDEAKGGRFLADAIKKRIESSKKVVFLIIGNKGKDEYGSKVEKTFNESENKIIRIDTQKYVDLAKYYQMSDLIVYPKQCSLSFYDAQACGVPVLFEDNEINRLRAQNGNAVLFRSDDIEDFRKGCLAMIEADELKYEEMSKNAVDYVKQKYDYRNITHEYIEVVSSACIKQGHSTKPKEEEHECLLSN